ncbi:MAG: GPW/gp25 family protein [Verrucomicrobiota bacterium]
MSGSHLSFPFHIGSNGRSVQVQSVEQQIHEELMQLLLTNPGERLFLPEFGGGLRQLVFENVDENTKGLVKARITQAISRWLGHRVTLEDVQAEFGQDDEMLVSVRYHIAGQDQPRVLKFQRGTG